MGEKKLRNGYTTGACASAAAKAAAIFLSKHTEKAAGGSSCHLPGHRKEIAGDSSWSRQSIQKERPVTAPAVVGETVSDEVELTLPDGSLARWKAVACRWDGSDDYFRVQKDAGDDPDVTDGVWVLARVERIDEEELASLRRDGRGYWLEAFPRLYLTGGAGIGIATKPGLSCPPGHYAINPVPRRMILSAVHEVFQEAEEDGTWMVTVAIPEGIRLAEKTFNPRLGIRGGISILGTTGIVKPMSEEALTETIRLDIHMKAAAKKQVVLMTPGNYGEVFLRDHLGVPMGSAVLCSNFVADASRMLSEEGIESVLFVGHIGKLIKVSAGRENTHSKYGDGRMEELARLTPEQTLAEQILRCNTTEEATGLLVDADLAEPVFARAARKGKAQMEAWAGGHLTVEVVVFSSAYGVVGQTGGAMALLEEWKA